MRRFQGWVYRRPCQHEAPESNGKNSDSAFEGGKVAASCIVDITGDRRSNAADDGPENPDKSHDFGIIGDPEIVREDVHHCNQEGTEMLFIMPRLCFSMAYSHGSTRFSTVFGLFCSKSVPSFIISPIVIVDKNHHIK
jgi:hypothetical protein